MEKLVCVVIPGYSLIDQDEHLKQILLSELGLNSSELHFVIQPQAALAYCIKEERIKMNPGDIVTVCHMEEEIMVRKRSFF